MAAIIVILAATGVLSSGSAAAPVYHIDESLVSPQAYEAIPGLWEYLIEETRIEWTEVDEAPSEPNNDVDHALTVTDGTIINGHAAVGVDENDYYRVTWTGDPQSLFVRLTWVGPAWLNVYIYDADLDPITYLNENTPSPKTLSMWQYNQGVFYVRVRAPGGESDYQLKFGIAGQISEPQNDVLDTTDLLIGAYKSPLKSVVCTSADPVDYFMVSIPSGCKSATITLDWFGSQDANLDFEVYGPNGVKVATADDSTDFETLFSPNVPAETYYIAVKAICGRAMYQLVVDSEVDMKIHIPPFELLRIPIWSPPWPDISDTLIKDEVVLYDNPGTVL
jgi:hypothetical protein